MPTPRRTDTAARWLAFSTRGRSGCCDRWTIPSTKAWCSRSRSCGFSWGTSAPWRAFPSTIDLGFSGLNRYLLLIFPLFFAIGAILKSRPVLFAFWLVISFWHYRQVDLCDYIGGLGEQRFGKCYVPQWVGHW
jgi:hypothetical protein